VEGRTIIHVDCKDNRIDFGEAGRFDYKDYHLIPGAEASLAVLVPVVLSAADSEYGRKWLKQVVIEGYTDTSGSYLYNLYLSLQRSYWVMCALVDPKRNEGLGLSDDQVKQVRELFLAGGVSFNEAKESAAASRRVELRLQFYTRKEHEETGQLARPRIESTGREECNLK
jgi:outer membrane protein OmpA-like peptidoglycan-associated protein